MLTIDPNRRISVDEALSHPYFESIRSIDDETVASQVFNFEFENETLDKKALQQCIWDDMLTFHPECRKVVEKQDNQIVDEIISKQQLSPEPLPWINNSNNSLHSSVAAETP